MGETVTVLKGSCLSEMGIFGEPLDNLEDSRSRSWEPSAKILRGGEDSPSVEDSSRRFPLGIFVYINKLERGRRRFPKLRYGGDVEVPYPT
jgi:hypothetical protein